MSPGRKRGVNEDSGIGSDGNTLSLECWSLFSLAAGNDTARKAAAAIGALRDSASIKRSAHAICIVALTRAILEVSRS